MSTFSKIPQRSIVNEDSKSVLLKLSQNQSVLTRNISLDNSTNSVNIFQKEISYKRSESSALAKNTTNKENRNNHHSRNYTRELLSSRPAIAKFPTLVFTEERTQPAKQHIPETKSSQAVQTDSCKVLARTRTDTGEEQPEMQNQFVSRVNYNIASQEEHAPNEELPTMTKTQPEATQLETSHHEITEGLVATVNQTTTTETEDTPLFRKRLQKVLGVKFIAAATKRTGTSGRSSFFVKNGIAIQ